MGTKAWGLAMLPAARGLCVLQCSFAMPARHTRSLLSTLDQNPCLPPLPIHPTASLQEPRPQAGGGGRMLAAHGGRGGVGGVVRPARSRPHPQASAWAVSAMMMGAAPANGNGEHRGRGGASAQHHCPGCHPLQRASAGHAE